MIILHARCDCTDNQGMPNCMHAYMHADGRFGACLDAGERAGAGLVGVFLLFDASSQKGGGFHEEAGARHLRQFLEGR